MADVKINVEIVSGAAQRAVQNLGRQTDRTENSFKALNVSIRNTTSAFKVFAGNLAAQAVSRFARTMFDAGASVIKTAGELETVATQFRVLTGSAATASAVIKDLQQFAATTPFQFQDIARASQRLLSFGFSISEVKTNLQGLGDVAAASGGDLGELALIFGQVRAAGKLTGERLLQLQERAIPIGPALAETMGVAESAIRDMVSRGEVDFATFEKAFQSLSEEGNFAFEGMIKRSQTLEGRLSTFRDNVELLAASFGSALAPAAKAILTVLTQLIQRLQDSGAINDFLNTMGSRLPGAIQFAVDAFQILNETIAGVRQFFVLFQAGLSQIVATTVDGVAVMLEAAKAAQDFIGIDTSGLDQTITALKRYADGAREVRDEHLAASDQIERTRVSVAEVITSTGQAIQTSYQNEILAAQMAAQETVAAESKKAEAVQRTKTINDLLREEAAQRAAEDRAAEIALREAQASEDLTFLTTNLGEKETARALARAKELEAENKHSEALKVLSQARLAAEKQAVAAQAQLDKQRESDRRSTLSTISTLSQSSNKELAAIGKAAALTQIAIDTPVAVGKALAAFPPPFNFAAAAAVGAAMAAQAAKVAGLNFEQGGIVPGTSFTGDRVAANVNSGEMILNRQQQARLFEMANRGGSGSQEIVVHTTVELDGAAIGKSVSRQVADGLQLGEVV